jgi:outer membrane protein assembly factor BamB
MSMTRTADGTVRKPLRLWPGVLLATLVVLLRFLVPLVMPDATLVGVIGGVFGGFAILLWWAFLSRAPWTDRVGAVVLMVVGVVITSWFVHESIRGGMMGRMLPVYFALPVMAVALVAWAAGSRGLSPHSRRVALLVTVLVACGSLTLVRTEGIMGDGRALLAWRWTPSTEEQFLAKVRDEPAAPPAAAAPATTAAPSTATAVPAAAEPPVTRTDAPAAVEPKVTPAADAPAAAPPTAVRAEWPGFRGPERDGHIRGVRIATDWGASPPVEVWRRPIGPAWSSFAVAGDLLYTQEQRGDDELVSAYRVSTGEPVWRHADAVRFYESNAGPGPRATPTVFNGRVYTLGATGVVNALDAATGAVAWTRNAAADTGAPLPGWGFTGSPLIVDDAVIVAASGRLVAYDLTTGAQRWTAQTKGGSYSSPHDATIDGVRQIVMLSGFGATSLAPATGAVLWEHAWAGTPIVQPALIPGGDILITTGDMMGGLGTRRLAIDKGPGGWTVAERWTSNGLKPYFNDYVIHDGHAFGFDGRILSCISLNDGARKWKGGRFGQGQLVLLPDQDLLLVLSEEGELALVRAASNQFTELARFPALDGKTWNHPVLVRDLLLVRNGEEMAAFRLPLAAR